MATFGIPKKEFEEASGWTVNDLNQNAKADGDDAYVPPKAVDPEQKPRTSSDALVKQTRAEVIRKKYIEEPESQVAAMYKAINPDKIKEKAAAAIKSGKKPEDLAGEGGDDEAKKAFAAFKPTLAVMKSQLAALAEDTSLPVELQAKIAFAQGDIKGVEAAALQSGAIFKQVLAHFSDSVAKNPRDATAWFALASCWRGPDLQISPLPSLMRAGAGVYFNLGFKPNAVRGKVHEMARALVGFPDDIKCQLLLSAILDHFEKYKDLRPEEAALRDTVRARIAKWRAEAATNPAVAKAVREAEEAVNKSA